MNKIKTGIIGVSAERGWATMAHIPALRVLPDYEVTAISNRNNEEAFKAGAKHQVSQIFQQTSDLVSSPDVDLVVVTVKVPHHKELVTAAINAGKNVFCEWPLGNGLQETEEIADLAARKNVKGFVGLQSRAIPAISFIKDLIREGYLGEVLSTTMVGSGIFYGDFVDQASAWAMDAVNGAGMMHTTFANAADALCFTLGEFKELNATAVNRRNKTRVIETGEMVPMDVPDQIIVNGLLENGAAAAIHYRGGISKGTNFFWEINGTKGDLLITADGGHLGVYEPVIKGANREGEILEVLAVPPTYFHIDKVVLSGPAHSVAENYERIASDLNSGTHLSANFHDALIRHRMLAAVETAAVTGSRQTYNYGHE
ncbi:MAG: Gfo/Idh/MocA family oxidoreductase [Bacteroidota bacterium]